MSPIARVPADHEICTCDPAAIVGVSEPGVSAHLRILRALRLITARRAGEFLYYSLVDAHVAAILQMGLARQGHHDAEVRAASA